MLRQGSGAIWRRSSAFKIAALRRSLEAPNAKKSVKPTDKPDSVHAGLPQHVTTITLGL